MWIFHLSGIVSTALCSIIQFTYTRHVVWISSLVLLLIQLFQIFDYVCETQECLLIPIRLSVRRLR